MNKAIKQNKIHRSFMTIVLCILFTMLCGLLTGCGGPAIQFAKSEVTMYVGDSQMLEYSLADEDADIEWSSSDSKIVSVRRGTVKANAEGSATIRASVGEEYAECVITVINRVVTISQETATIDLDSGNLSITLTATSSDGGTISWSTSDPEIATVSNGVVTATGEEIGDVIITASRGDAKASCLVSVIMPSRPADYYNLTKETNANVLANPGKWYYFADGSTGTDHSFVEEPLHQNSSISMILGNLNLANSRYFYLRYQPTFEVGQEFTMKFDLTISGDAKFRMYSGSGSTVRSITAKANTELSVSYLGVVSTSEPFSLRFSSCDDLQNGKATTMVLKNIKVELGNTGPVVEEVAKRSEKADLSEYQIETARNAEIVLDRGAWYYSADGEPNTDYSFVDKPSYKNGTATMSFNNIAGYSKENGKVTYQLRYQPDYEVGQYYKLTADVNLTAPGKISYGTKVSNNETYYYGLDYVEAGTQKIEFIGYVNSSFPFAVGITPNDPSAPIALNISNLIIEKTEKPAPDVNDVYNLNKRTNAEVVSNPGIWAFTAPSGALFNEDPSYNAGIITMDLQANNVDGIYQLRYQPDEEVGTPIKVEANVSLIGEGYFVFGNDKDANLKISKNLTPNEDGSYTISWIGEVYTTPIYFGLMSNDSYQSALKIVISNFTYTTEFEVENPDDGGDTPEGNIYELVKRTNSETCANPGVWAYTAPENATFNTNPIFADGVITFDLAANTVNGEYGLRYQPDLRVDSVYKVEANVSLTGNGYFLYGNDYKNSKDLTPNEDGTYTISWTGTVSTNPFYFILRSNDSFVTSLKLVVNQFTYEEIKTDDSNSYEILKKSNSEVCANPDVWGYTAPTGALFSETPSYDNGVITFALDANTPSGDYQLRFQPNLAIETSYKVSAKVTIEGNGYFLYGNDYKSSKQLTADENGVYNVNWTGVVSTTPYYFVVKSNDSFATPLKLTVLEFAYEGLQAESDNFYTLQKKTNSETCANPGVWAYTAPTGVLFSEDPTYNDGVITFALDANTPSGDYQLRYQPELDQGVSYTVSATVKFEGNVFFLYGNDYKNAKDLTPNEDGSYTISWTGTVSTTPFYFVVKTNDNFATPLKIIVSDFVITTAN